jgi:phospholipase A1
MGLFQASRVPTDQPVAWSMVGCGLAALGSALAVLPGSAWAQAEAGVAGSPQQAALQACWLRELRGASPQTTVAELRARCRAAAQPGGDGPTASGAGGVGPASPAEAAVPAAVPSTMDRLLDIFVPTQIQVAKRAAKPGESLFERRVASELRAVREPFALLPHRPIYLSPISVQERTGSSAEGGPQGVETTFQISFKFPMARPLFEGRLLPFFAYTGRAWWQVYDAQASRPFREYNHEPEFVMAVPIKSDEILGWRPRLVSLAFNHNSNGQTGSLSRSWNRLVGEVWLDRDEDFWASLRMWKRIPERAKQDPLDTDGDDNPDITRYLGHAELKIGRALSAGSNLTLTWRQSLRSGGKGALQLDWSQPIEQSPALRWYAGLFTGYGDSLIDYDRRIDRISLGVMLADWF